MMAFFQQMFIFKLQAQLNYYLGILNIIRYYDEDNFYSLELNSSDKNSINLYKKY